MFVFWYVCVVTSVCVRVDRPLSVCMAKKEQISVSALCLYSQYQYHSLSLSLPRFLLFFSLFPFNSNGPIRGVYLQ